MEPYFFGASGRRLFGAYHAPSGAKARNVGALICAPWGQEAIRAHRALHQLALQLAARGFHVLRFDYSGCGDSEDPPAGGELERWTEEVAIALEELREGADVVHSCAIGLRLGATLAALAARAQPAGVRPDALVLWNPVVDGAAHLAELDAQHAQWLAGSFAKPRRGSAGRDEILGFGVSPELRRELAGVSLGELPAPECTQLLLVDSAGDPRLPALRQHWSSAAFRELPAPPIWRKGEDESENATVPADVLVAIVEWLEASFA